MSDDTNNLNRTLLDIAEAVFFSGQEFLLKYEYTKIEKSMFYSNETRQFKLKELEISIQDNKLGFAKSTNNELNFEFAGFN